MRIIFSKDRPAQLDLLLTSLERNAQPEETVVIAHASIHPTWRNFYGGAYEMLFDEHTASFFFGNADVFERDTRALLADAGDFVSFFCDDDVLFAPLGGFWDVIVTDPEILTFSFRLGGNTTYCYPSGFEQASQGQVWSWLGAGGDWSYAGSLDGHIFRTADVRHMLRGRPFRNPTELEDQLMAGCLEMSAERPLMACYPRSVLCSVPVNRVSEQSQVRAGERFPVSAEALNERFLAGWRLSLEALDFSAVDSAHFEVDLEAAWRKS